MKKRSLVHYLILLTFLVVTFSGCTSFDSKVNVVFKIDDNTIYHVSKISNFENNLIPGISKEHIPNGKDFIGWGFSQDQTENLLPDKGLITVKYIKSVLSKVDKTVIMYPVFAVKKVVAPDLVIGWYNLPATSGMTSEIADAYKKALTTYLSSIGKGDLNVVVRPYEGNVAASGALILKDGDVDILIGWGGNLTSSGGVPTVQRAGSIKIGAVDGRYVDLISQKELAMAIFDWTVKNASTILSR